MKLKVIGIHENSPSQANSKTDSKNPFSQAQNKMKENSKEKNNGKLHTFSYFQPHTGTQSEVV